MLETSKLKVTSLQPHPLPGEEDHEEDEVVEVAKEEILHHEAVVDLDPPIHLHLASLSDLAVPSLIITQ